MASFDELVRAARTSIEVFARVLVGEPLWPHQLEVARSDARIVGICSGRQAGKSRTLVILALFEVFRAPGRRVLVLSAGEDAAKDLLAEASMLVGAAALLSSAVVDDTTTQLTLTNGSSIRSIPASEKQARGKSIDLLILDEAAYITDDVWRAARYTVLARPESRVVMASTPRGRRDRFFSKHYHLAKGAEGPVVEAGISVESFHWPSTVSPLVDADLVEFWRRTDEPRVFQREVLAEWVDEAGQWFSSEELDENVAPFEMIRPGTAMGQWAVGGVDWGATQDANAVAVIGVLRDGDLNDGLGFDEPVFVLAWAAEKFGSMNAWARELAEVADPEAGGFDFRYLASEANGCGTGPTELLQEEVGKRDVSRWRVKPVWTTNQRKQAGFGVMKLLLQQHRLVLPREPWLRRQLENLEYETSESGTVMISVPESKGHDDVAMATMQASACIQPVRAGRPDEAVWGDGDLVETPAGVRLFERPRLAKYRRGFRAPPGHEDMEKGW